MDSNERNDNTANYLKKQIESRGLPRNQLAAISGLSNTYIQHLENGDILNVNRKKVIALAVALNLDLHETDKLLTAFDRAKLTEKDIPLFIDPGSTRKITSAMLPMHSAFTYELFTLSLETIPGKMVIVAERPTANVLPEGYRTYFNRNKVDPHPIYFKLLEAAGQARQNNFINILSKYPVELYICRECLDAYIHANIEDKQWKIRHVKMLIQFIDNYDNFSVSLLDCCSRFNFAIKTPDLSIGGNDKLHFLGKAPHTNAWESGQSLFGFVTENPAIVHNFKKGLQWIKSNTVLELNDKEKMIDYLHGLLT